MWSKVFDTSGSHLEIESSESLDEKIELYAVDPLFSRGINKFLWESSCQLHETNPDRFIEHVTDQSWVSYLNNMSQQSTWCDHFAVQALHQVNLIVTICYSNKLIPTDVFNRFGGIGPRELSAPPPTGPRRTKKALAG